MALFGPNIPTHQTPNVNESDFGIAGAGQAQSQLSDLSGAADNINFDWSGVNSAISQMNAAESTNNAFASGAESTAGQQLGLNTDRNDYTGAATAGQAAQALGKSTSEAGQFAGQAEAANVAQQNSAIQFQTQANQAQTQLRMNQAQMQLDLTNQQFQLTNQIQQTQQGLSLAQSTLMNTYYNTLATAKNQTEAMNIGASTANQQSTFTQLGAGLQSLSAISAGLAAYAGAPDDDENNNTFKPAKKL